MFTASFGALQILIDNAFLGPIPEIIPIAFVKNTAFVTSVGTNPFHFHHYDVTNLVLLLLGIRDTIFKYRYSPR